jgi:hypothetical protein
MLVELYKSSTKKRHGNNGSGLDDNPIFEQDNCQPNKEYGKNE